MDEAYRDELDDLRNEINNLEDTITELRNEISDKDSRITELEEDLQEAHGYAVGLYDTLRPYR